MTITTSADRGSTGADANRATASPSATSVLTEPLAAAMTHREVLQALSGLFMGMFVALLSSTVVSSSLPRIVSDLGGTQAAYTWIITATLLAMTVTTPIWGKLADLTNRKLLLQIALVLFTVGSMLAGLSTSTSMMIGFRVLQGVGVGGIMALVQVVMSDIVSPRDRGRYMGLLGAIVAVPTIAGPLIGGVITDSIGWRWNFYVAVPVAVAAVVLLQRTLHLPVRRRKVQIDYLGILFISSGVSLLLVWVSLAGSSFAWGSPLSFLLASSSVVLLIAAVAVERRVAEPLIPPALFRNRTVVLAIIATLSMGVVLVSTSVFLSQYMQLARGKTPTESGVLTIPMVLGTLVASILVGRIITKTGVWKPYVVAGSVLTFIGAALMGTLRFDTNLGLVGVYMAIMGLGIGMTMQNLILVVQNSVDLSDMGSASSTIAFFRTLGGAVGISALGAVAAHQVSRFMTSAMTEAGVPVPAGGVSNNAIPNVREMAEPMRGIVEAAFGHAIGDVFAVAAPILLIAIVATILLPNHPLGTRSGIERAAEEDAALIELEAEFALPAVPTNAAAIGHDEDDTVTPTPVGAGSRG